MKANRKLLLAFCLIMAAGTSLLALVSYGDFFPQAQGSPLRTPDSSGTYFFGNSSPSFSGWYMSAKILVSTSYVTNQSLNGFVGATFNVFPYQISQNTSLYLGLYVNGMLVANQSYNLSAGRASPAVIQNHVSNQTGDRVATFSSSMEGYSVTLLSLRNRYQTVQR